MSSVENRVTRKVLIFVLLSLFGCTQKPHQQNNKNLGDLVQKVPPTATGIIHKRIGCISDTSFSYALYLPRSYTGGEEVFPVIFFFDAHKRGVLPVEKYAGLAEEFGFILAGSNNSENGQQSTASKQAVSMMMDDVLRHFRIDEKRIATAGFSGGARVAADVALFQNKGVSSVIGCAAGFPQMRGDFNTAFSYLGMVGDKDFNYLEMKNLDNGLDQTPIPHYLLVYEGKHDWPLADVMRDGFEFLRFVAMKRMPELMDTSLINNFLSLNDSIRKKAFKEKDWERLANADIKVLAFLKGLTFLELYSKELYDIQQNPAYIKLQLKQKQSFELEAKMQQQYASAMPTKNLEWWLTEINVLAQQLNNAVNVRLLNYLSLVSYMYASSSLRDNQFGDTEKYLTIYEKVDPENPEVYYLKAVLLARTGKPKLALIQLQKAADKGFDEFDRLNSNYDFRQFEDDESFNKILLQVKRNTI